MKLLSMNILKRGMYVGFIVVSIFSLWVWSEYGTYRQVSEEYQYLQLQTQEYLALKGRWKYDAASETVAMLKSHPKLVRQEKVRGGYRFEFASLSSSDFNTLANAILNVPFTIKKLTMKRHTDSKGEISVEFEE